MAIESRPPDTATRYFFLGGHAASAALNCSKKSLNGICPEIAMQRLGESDGAVGSQPRLDQRNIESRQSRARTVQGVAEAIFPILILETEVHSARLKVAKI